MNGDALILQDLANDLDAVQPRTAMAARNGARALRDAEAREPHVRALLAELGAADVVEAVMKARLLREGNGETQLRELPLFQKA